MKSIDIEKDYQATIGIECHVQLATKTKLFSGADNDAREAAPNTTVSPICFGLPGVLPVLNKRAVELAIRAGVALNATVSEYSSFDRKHYFYPDLPKGYQITQLEKPVVVNGRIDVPMEDGNLSVRIERAHLEEDAGKLTHPAGADYSLVDLNRAGTPLIEIVSAPDIHSPLEAKAYAQELYLLMTSAGVTHGDLYHGNMRFDVNISIARKGSKELGTRVEVKNLNSFRSVERAALYEFKRQVELVEKGGTVVQETRGWDDTKQKTASQRSKEDAHDYRYFPDADIPPVVIDQADVQAVAAELSKILPPAIRKRLSARNVSAKSIETLFIYPMLLDRVLQIEDEATDSELKTVVDLLVNVLPPEFDEGEILKADAPYLPHPAELLVVARLAADAKISGSGAKELVRRSWKTLNDAAAEAERLGLMQMSDEAAIETVVDSVLADPASAKSLEDIRAGNQKAIGYLVGQVMKHSGGKANPQVVQKLIRSKL